MSAYFQLFAKFYLKYGTRQHIFKFFAKLKKKKKLEICNVSAYSQIIREIKKFNLRNQFLIVTNLFEIFFENITMGAVTIYDKKKRKKQNITKE